MGRSEKKKSLAFLVFVLENIKLQGQIYSTAKDVVEFWRLLCLLIPFFFYLPRTSHSGNQSNEHRQGGGVTEAEKRQNDINLECGVSNWLTTLLLKEWGMTLTNNNFGTPSEYATTGASNDCLQNVYVVKSLTSVMPCPARKVVWSLYATTNWKTSFLKEICHNIRLSPRWLR